MSKFFGIDISRWNIISDYDELTKHGLAFVYVKATQGATGIDPAFETHANSLNPLYMLNGYYHYFICNQDPVQQANHFWATIEPHMNGFSLPPVIDLEDPNCGLLADD